MMNVSHTSQQLLLEFLELAQPILIFSGQGGGIGMYKIAYQTQQVSFHDSYENILTTAVQSLQRGLNRLKAV